MMLCVCGHAPEDHSGSGECQAYRCRCAYYEVADEEDGDA